jgi:hypothetical protein
MIQLIKIEDGEYARGKSIQVTDENQSNTASVVLEGLAFLSKIRQPGDELTIECKSFFTKSGRATLCEASLTEGRSKNILF